MKTFPDSEEWCMSYLGDIAPVYTVTPATITETIIQVNRVGGTSDLITDRPRLEIGVYVPEGEVASARAEAWRITELVRNKIDQARGKTANGQLCDQGRIDNPPFLIPDANSTLRRVVTTVQLSFRRQ